MHQSDSMIAWWQKVLLCTVLWPNGANDVSCMNDLCNIICNQSLRIPCNRVMELVTLLTKSDSLCATITALGLWLVTSMAISSGCLSNAHSKSQALSAYMLPAMLMACEDTSNEFWLLVKVASSTLIAIVSEKLNAGLHIRCELATMHIKQEW